MKNFQSTLKQAISFSGHGVHSGKPCTVVIEPAPVDHGIVFCRTDNEGKVHRFPATTAYAGPTDLCTTLGQGDFRVETVEHLMAAVAASGLDNLVIGVSAREIPILDGSAAVFMQEIARAGIEMQNAARKYIRVIKTVRVGSASGFAGFAPSGEDTMRFDISIAFASPVIGEQHIAFDLESDHFLREIAPARTFGFLKDVETLWVNGLALGASLQNSTVIGRDDRILNDDGLFAGDAFVRHKALDAVGDTALLGHPFIGVFRSFRGGHSLNGQAVRALLDDPQAFEIMEVMP